MSLWSTDALKTRQEENLTQATLRAGALYFIVVFAAGFILGTIRTLWVVPRFGTRWAELMEAPVMVLISFLAARWVVRRLSMPFNAPRRFALGFVALICMLVAESAFAFWLRGLTIREYWAGRDPISGNVYLAALGLFALMPLLIEKQSH